MRKLSFLFVVILLGTMGCEKDASTEVFTGDLNVRVILDNLPVENALVTASPSSKQGFTDRFGRIVLEDLESGKHEIFASLENFGSGKAFAIVLPDQVVTATVTINSGVFFNLAPSILITEPQPNLESNLEFAEGESITFSAQVEDLETENEDIKIAWESSIDGELYAANLTPDGISTLSVSSLSRGIHQISLRAEDLDGNVSIASIQVSTLGIPDVTLLTPLKDTGRVILNWTEYSLSDFSKYEIYRGTGSCPLPSGVLLPIPAAELITTITEQQLTTFVDPLPPLEFEACYFVRVYNVNGNFRDSNQEMVVAPSGHIFEFVPSDFLKHPTKPFVYLIDADGRRIVKYDYERLIAVNVTETEGVTRFCAIGDLGFGVELFVPSSDGHVYALDADDFNLNEKIATGDPATAVVVDDSGIIKVSVRPSPWWDGPVRSFDRSTGMLVEEGGEFDDERLRRVPGTYEYISLTEGISPIDMNYYKFDESGNFLEYEDDVYHGDHPLDAKIFRISDAGDYLITSQKGSVFSADSALQYMGSLDLGDNLFSDFAFNDDSSLIYASTSNLKSIQIVSYPSLTKTNEIKTKGFPEFMIKDGDKIISLSRTIESGMTSGVEIINL